jgi:hypothetical protein
VKRKRMCKLCGIRPATVPDRNASPGRFVAAICGDCHAKRLAADLARIVPPPHPDGGRPT